MPERARRPIIALVRRVVAVAADRRRVLRPGERVLLACSGGPDSTALLDALSRLAPPRGWSILVAHVDHGLRPGGESESRHVAMLAEERALPFVALRVTVEAGPSLQERAREARHAALREAAHRAQASAIALGHTADDQAETVLMRALSSATPRSILAMAERNGALARPLLRVWRADTEAYCAALGISVLEDPSNRDPRFLRSRVRHELMPALEAVFPGARRRLVVLAERQRQALQADGPPPDP